MLGVFSFFRREFISDLPVPCPMLQFPNLGSPISPPCYTAISQAHALPQPATPLSPLPKRDDIKQLAPYSQLPLHRIQQLTRCVLEVLESPVQGRVQRARKVEQQYRTLRGNEPRGAWFARRCPLWCVEQR